MASVEMPHPAEVVFTYLADPRNRPEWQSSLMSITLTDRSEPHVGMKWRESTVVGLRPRMEITHLEPYRLWAERGRWHGVTGTLALRFTAVPGGTRVRAEGEVTGRGPWAPWAAAAGRVASRAIKADLIRASTVLTQRGHAG